MYIENNYVSGDNVRVPTVVGMNAILPETIRIFKILKPADVFSARRSCDTRTYEYILPTYVFAPPPAETGYRYEERTGMTQEVLDSLYPDANPSNDNSGEGSLFTTLRRAASGNRRSNSFPAHHAEEALPVYSAQSPAHAVPPPPLTPQNQAAQSPSSGNAFSRFFENLRGRSKRKSAAIPTSATSANLPTTSAEVSPARNNSAAARRNSQRASSRSGRYRSRSREPNAFELTDDERDREGVSFQPYEDDNVDTTSTGSRKIQYRDPMELPAATPEAQRALKAYRMTESQIAALHGILDIYRGTHNWHNFIPGASPDDQRCYIRVMDMEISGPEVRAQGPGAGMEFIRLKVRARAFARYQIRKMVALAVMVVRTNTPRSLVAASFGVKKIEIPEAPAFGVLFDMPIYEDYNNAPTRVVAEQISFDDEKAIVERFRQTYIHERIFKDEEQFMPMFDWIRHIDTYAFLYHHYLNPRGLIQRQTMFLRPSNLDTATEEENQQIYNFH